MFLEQRDNVLWLKMNGLIRYIMIHLFSSYFPLYIVNEYPKSGGSWLSQMLSKAIGVPFPRNRLPIFGSSIMHGHYMHQWNMKNVVILWRDGRDVLVSQYYHSFFRNELSNNRLVQRTRKELWFHDYEDITNNLPSFIRYVYLEKKHLKFTWADFVDRWIKHKYIIEVRYEDLRKNTSEQLNRIVAKLTGTPKEINEIENIVQEFSFERQTGRKPGQQDIGSFIRKGIIGDWQNYFTKESRELFAHYAGKQLLRLGYEKDNSWINKRS